MKIRPVEAELFHEAGRTDMTKSTATFHNSAKEPKNCSEDTDINDSIILKCT